MTMNIIRNTKLKFTQITTVNFIVLAGVAGWVDTDVSATTGTDTNKLWLVSSWHAASGECGVRPHGSAVSPTAASYQTTSFLSYVDASGHFDLYREAIGDSHYRLLGYLS